jgi:phosphomannomutase
MLFLSARLALTFATGLSVIHEFDYCFAENGLTAYELGKELPSQSFIGFLGEDRYKLLVNFVLHYLADMDLPIKRYLTILFDLH